MYVLYCHGTALGETADVGKYLVAFDVDARNGLGSVELGTLDQAMRFRSRFEAVQAVTTTSKVRPKRDDGHHNRPLTAWHWEVQKDGGKE